MAFLLSRGGKNIPAEVQRWQYFLLKTGFNQVGAIDGDFSAKTQLATRYFQTKNNLKASGALDKPTLEIAKTLGYTIVADDYYRTRNSANWPAKPPNIKSPTNKWRNQQFNCFTFKQLDRRHRSDPESIVIGGSCDGRFADWTRQFIVDIEVKQLRFAKGYQGYIRCHTIAAPYLLALFEAWEKADLLHLIARHEGCFVPRYKRRQSPGDAAQSERQSVDVDQLSNHSFGSAIDMNYEQNTFPNEPALCGHFGSTRELVGPAAAVGFYWGGYFKDGNHFELADLSRR